MLVRGEEGRAPHILSQNTDVRRLATNSLMPSPSSPGAAALPFSSHRPNRAAIEIRASAPIFAHSLRSTRATDDVLEVLLVDEGASGRSGSVPVRVEQVPDYDRVMLCRSNIFMRVSCKLHCGSGPWTGFAMSQPLVFSTQ